MAKHIKPLEYRSDPKRSAESKAESRYRRTVRRDKYAPTAAFTKAVAL